LNYTTEVKVEKTIDEIKAILRAHKARSITEVYDGDNITAIEFVFDTGWGPRPYQLPAKPDAVLRLMVERRNQGKDVWDGRYLDPDWTGETVRYGHKIPQSMRDQAERTAWRTI
jgi:DNA-binding protein H-NS